jgi:transposase-like protein
MQLVLHDKLKCVGCDGRGRMDFRSAKMKDRIRRRDPERLRHWEDVVRRWRESGQSVREYCRAQGMEESAFYFWRRTLARRGHGLAAEDAPQVEGARKPVPRSPKRGSLPRRDAPAFLPVQVVEAGAVEATRGVEIVLAHGRTVRVGSGFDRQTLADVLAVLESRPC